MKVVISILWMIALLGTSFSAIVPRREIRLQGNYNFNQIIVETENQLDLSIHLPSEINNKTQRKYNQIITLQQLCDAIVNQFAQNNIPLTYTYSKSDLTFKRSDVIKPTRPSYAPKTSNKKPKIPTISQPPKQEEEPYLPSWANRTPKQPITTNSELPVITRSGLRNNTSSQINDLDEPFQVSLPKRKNSFEPIQAPQATTRTYDLDSITSIQQRPQNTQASHSSQSQAGFSITPYPENAQAFINDAPAIVPGTGKENYIEWETRMRGALESQNVKVLQNERLELERRLRWLDQQLP